MSWSLALRLQTQLCECQQYLQQQHCVGVTCWTTCYAVWMTIRQLLATNKCGKIISYLIKKGRTCNFVIANAGSRVLFGSVIGGRGAGAGHSGLLVVPHNLDHGVGIMRRGAAAAARGAPNRRIGLLQLLRPFALHRRRALGNLWWLILDPSNLRTCCMTSYCATAALQHASPHHVNHLHELMLESLMMQGLDRLAWV